jgi:hypothetical protein
MISTIGDFIVDISQADREHSTIGCEVVHCCDAVVTHVTLYHIFQDLLMYALQLASLCGLSKECRLEYCCSGLNFWRSCHVSNAH